jgi:hypothetical protein
MRRLEEWSLRVYQGNLGHLDRTRLTDPLTFSFTLRSRQGLHPKTIVFSIAQ